MKRSDLSELGIEKETIDKILDLVGAEKKELEAKIKEKDETISDMQSKTDKLSKQIKELESGSDEIATLKKKVADYEETEKQRKAKEETDKKNAELLERFNKVVGEKKFIHDDIKTGRFNAFKSALEDKANEGKGDSDIFEVITKDMDCFVNKQKEKFTLEKNGSGEDDEKPVFKGFF